MAEGIMQAIQALWGNMGPLLAEGRAKGPRPLQRQYKPSGGNMGPVMV